LRSIFVSYRRDDSEGEAGRLFDDLVAVFGEKSVFMDVTAIEVGRDFRKVIDDSLATCGVLLAVIGKAWVDAKNEAGQRRLDDPSDFVRLETASALGRDIRVVPVLVHGASMPRSEELPDDLKALSYRNGVELTHAHWSSDLQLLIKALRPDVEEAQDRTGIPKPETVEPTAEELGSRISSESIVPDVPADFRKGSKKPLGTLLALVAAVVVAAMVAIYMIVPRKQVTVPDLSGYALPDATAKLESLHLAVGQKTFRQDSSRDPNTVLSQSPSPNTQAKIGSAVDLVLSQPSMAEIPPLAGESLDAARRSLADRQLQIGMVERKTKAGVAPDTVLQEFPVAGDKVQTGSKVDLLLSEAPESPTPGTAPNRKTPGKTQPERTTAANVRHGPPLTDKTIVSRRTMPATSQTGTTSHTTAPATLRQPLIKIVKVVLTQPWTATGVQVAGGQNVTISAHGDMNWYTAALNPPGCPPGKNCHAGPDGYPRNHCQGNIAPNLNCLSLIGKIGKGQPFFVGGYKQFVAGVSGEIELGVNDTYFPDNTGQWTATIVVGGPGQ
jgi:beta-lactam-binding protein with PASTA domain